MLGKFRDAISTLDEAVIDITLIGMNAGVKASHLGVKGRAFVVIANELQQTADSISGAKKLLEPVLHEIGQAADRLKRLRLEEDPLKVADLEESIAVAVADIENSNARLHHLMGHLTHETGQFESLMTAARAVMSGLSEKFASLPQVASLIEQQNPATRALSPGEARAAGELYGDLYSLYTMETERGIHLRHCDRFGIASKRPLAAAPKADADDVLFF